MKKRKILYWLLLLSPMIITLTVYPYLPSQIPIRYGHGSKVVLFIMPIMVFIFLSTIPFLEKYFYSEIERKKPSIYNKRNIYLFLLGINIYQLIEIFSGFNLIP